MLNNEKGQSLIEVLVVLVLAAMMIVALITIVLVSLKNAQFAQNQTKATKLAQDTIDNIRILRDNNQNKSLLPNDSCFDQLWNTGSTDFGCGGGDDCYYGLVTFLDPPLLRLRREALAFKENLGDGFLRQIKVTQDDVSNPDDGLSPGEVKLVVEISWTDSTGEHKSNLETYLIKPNYDCI